MLSFYIYKDTIGENYLHRVRSTVKYARRSINARLVLDPGVYYIVPDILTEESCDEDQNATAFNQEQNEFAKRKRLEIITQLKGNRHRQDTSKLNTPLYETLLEKTNKEVHKSLGDLLGMR